MDTSHIDATTIHATVRGLRQRARKVPAAKRGAHWQMAKRRISNACLLADSNVEQAVAYCWEARSLLNSAEAL